MIRQLPSGRRLGADVLDGWIFDFSRLRLLHIKEPDSPWLHNHPWLFCWSLILNGGYTHEYATLQPDGSLGERAFRTFRPGDVNFMPHSMVHRIDSVLPETYTQLFYGPDIEGPQFIRYHTPTGLLSDTEMKEQGYLAAASQ